MRRSILAVTVALGTHIATYFLLFFVALTANRFHWWSWEYIARHRPVLHATAFGAIALVLQLLYYRYDWRSLTLDPLYAAQAMVVPAALAGGAVHRWLVRYSLFSVCEALAPSKRDNSDLSFPAER